MRNLANALAFILPLAMGAAYAVGLTNGYSGCVAQASQSNTQMTRNQ